MTVFRKLTSDHRLNRDHLSRLPRDNDYELLARFLSPWKLEKEVEALRELARKGDVVWGRLLYQANFNLVTPQWYLQLCSDGLLQELPQELQDYLSCLYQENAQRNQNLFQALKEIVARLGEEGIQTLLLKGAGTFTDDLYGDSGARVMGDLDLLVPSDDAARAGNLLLEMGYQQPPRPGMEYEGLPTDARHHHLPPFHNPETLVCVEIHYKILYAEAGRVLKAEQLWENAAFAKNIGINAYVLNPTFRLLHNTLHALLPHREFIRGEISLSHLIEFCWLARRYEEKIDWEVWISIGRQNGLNKHFVVYLALAHKLMGMPLPEDVTVSKSADIHVHRILAASHLNRSEREKETVGLKPRDSFMQLLVKGYYAFHLPGWVWRNICYAEGWNKLPLRIKYLVKRLGREINF